MIVAAITEHSSADYEGPIIETALYTAELTGLAAGVGLERANALTEHYRRMHQDSAYQVLCAQREGAVSPEFDLHRLASCKDPLRLIIGERLNVDYFIARESASAPDTIIAVGDFLDEVDDWEACLCIPITRSTFPSRIEIITRVVGMFTDTCARSITYMPAQADFPPILLVTTVPHNGAMHNVLTTRNISF